MVTSDRESWRKILRKQVCCAEDDIFKEDEWLLGI